MTALRDWDHLVTDIPERGLAQKRTATEEERVELARELDIASCESLAASYEIKALGAGRYALRGTLEAAVTQACVVSLEPVPTRLSEAFAVELAPADALAGEAPVLGDREVSSIPDVEPIEDGRIATGAILFGILSAALPAYPRAPGAAFEWVDPKAEAGGDTANPFAALGRLKPQS